MSIKDIRRHIQDASIKNMDYGINQVLLTCEGSRAMVSENLRSKMQE